MKTRRFLRHGLLIYSFVLSRTLLFSYRLLSKLPRGRFVASNFLELIHSDTVTAQTDVGEIIFSNTSWITDMRARKFSEQEPETLSWITSFPPGSIFWDVGANVGSFSLYAAQKGHFVVSFEPSPWNQEVLAKNILLNRASKNILTIPLCLTDTTTRTSLFLSRDFAMPGGAHNSVKEPVNQYGSELSNFFELQVLAVSIDMLRTLHSLPEPDFIKIDVDGMEFEVLNGARETLKNVTSILVEYYDGHPRKEELINLLIQEKFFLVESCRDNSNHIWSKVKK